MVGVACVLQLAPDRTISEARLASTGAGAAPIRARDAERQLAGQSPVARRLHCRRRSRGDVARPAV